MNNSDPQRRRINGLRRGNDMTRVADDEHIHNDLRRAPSTKRKRSYEEMQHGGSKLLWFPQKGGTTFHHSFSPQRDSAASPLYFSSNAPHGTSSPFPSRKKSKSDDPILEAITLFLKQKRFATISELISELKRLDLMCDIQKIYELGEKSSSFDVVKSDIFEGLPTYVSIKDHSDQDEGAFSESDHFSGTEDDSFYFDNTPAGKRHSELWDFPNFSHHSSSHRRDNVLFNKRILFDQPEDLW
eukprot:CAMPEP_0117448918 /NCGR_PEP_ID=MMETSP0759-20121206/7660_1 /TAXON_ID=63605 /ORGANISM="Percolomonas cosmopolitus, Strain WS" /LENGTH=241 /DNA_ID=CAMNT_0005241343 /DNA_START=87 /DNA_END=809 /DNA_ORIENTATION=-